MTQAATFTISRWPRGVTRRARDVSVRSIHPRASRLSSSAAPSAPPRWGLRSLQSGQVQANCRRLRRGGAQVDAKLPHRLRAGGAEVDGAARHDQPARFGHSFEKTHRKFPGQVVITGARLPQCRRRRAGDRHGTHARRLAGQRRRRKCLDRHTNFRRGQPVIAIAPARFHGEQTAFRHAGQMAAGGRGRQPGDHRQFAGRPGAAIHQRPQHGRTAGVGQQAGKLAGCQERIP